MYVFVHVSVCMYVCAIVYACAYVCMCLCVYACECAFMCVCVSVCALMSACVYMCMYVHLCGDTCHGVHLCRSAGDLSESVFSFYHIILGTELRLSGLVRRYLYILSYLSGPRLSSKPLLNSLFFSNVHCPFSRSTKILLFCVVLCEQIALDN